MQPKHEVIAVRAAARLLLQAALILRYASDSVAIGVRTDIEKSFQRLGPDHQPGDIDELSIRTALASSFGEEFAADVIDGGTDAKAPPVQTDADRRLATLEQNFREMAAAQESEIERLRRENRELLERATAPQS